jgi:hypothetical protein
MRARYLAVAALGAAVTLTSVAAAERSTNEPAATRGTHRTGACGLGK